MVEALPRPSELCGAYLFGRDGVLYSTYGGLQSWDEKAGAKAFEAAMKTIDAAMKHPSGRLPAMVGPSRIDTC